MHAHSWKSQWLLPINHGPKNWFGSGRDRPPRSIPNFGTGQDRPSPLFKIFGVSWEKSEFTRFYPTFPWLFPTFPNFLPKNAGENRGKLGIGYPDTVRILGRVGLPYPIPIWQKVSISTRPEFGRDTTSFEKSRPYLLPTDVIVFSDSKDFLRVSLVLKIHWTETFFLFIKFLFLFKHRLMILIKSCSHAVGSQWIK